MWRWFQISKVYWSSLKSYRKKLKIGVVSSLRKTTGVYGAFSLTYEICMWQQIRKGSSFLYQQFCLNPKKIMLSLTYFWCLIWVSNVVISWPPKGFFRYWAINNGTLAVAYTCMYIVFKSLFSLVLLFSLVNLLPWKVT